MGKYLDILKLREISRQNEIRKSKGNFGHAGRPGQVGGSAPRTNYTKSVNTAEGIRTHEGYDPGYDFSDLNIQSDEMTQGFRVKVEGMPKLNKKMLENKILSEALNDSINVEKQPDDSVIFSFIHVTLLSDDLGNYDNAKKDWLDYFQEVYPKATFTMLSE